MSLGQTIKRKWLSRFHKIQINHSSSNDIEQLERKIDSITKSLSKPYFNKILKEVIKKELKDAKLIWIKC